MIRLIVAMAMLGMASAASAQSMTTTPSDSAQPSSSPEPMLVRKPCEELRAEIDTKIRNNGVPMFTLDVVDMDAPVAEGKVVGTCDGQTKKIVYKRA
jgi:hypothetical protein